MIPNMTSNSFLILPLFALSAWIIQPTAACHGFKIKSTSISWCSDEKESPIGFENIGLSWDENCVLKLDEGSKITYRRKINKMEIYYEMKNCNNSLVAYEGEVENLCDELKHVEEKDDKETLYDFMQMWGVPKECPMDERIVNTGECDVHGSMTKSGLKSLFNGRNELNFTLDTDVGFACLCTAIEIEENGNE